jgi:hypothetical protein
MKHLKHTLATCVYSHCNIYNTQIKHLKYTSETHENTRNMTSSAATTYLVDNYDSQQAWVRGCREQWPNVHLCHRPLYYVRAKVRDDGGIAGKINEEYRE